MGDQMVLLQEEHAGQEHKDGGEKLNGAVAQRVTSALLGQVLRLSFLQEFLRVLHVLLYTTLGLHLINEGWVSDLLNADGVIILLVAPALTGPIFKRVALIHASAHELFVSLCSWRRPVDVVTAVIFFVCGLGAIMTVHVVVVVVFLLWAAETKMWSWEAPYSIPHSHTS